MVSTTSVAASCPAASMRCLSCSATGRTRKSISSRLGKSNAVCPEGATIASQQTSAASAARPTGIGRAADGERDADRGAAHRVTAVNDIELPPRRSHVDDQPGWLAALRRAAVDLVVAVGQRARALAPAAKLVELTVARAHYPAARAVRDSIGARSAVDHVETPTASVEAVRFAIAGQPVRAAPTEDGLDVGAHAVPLTALAVVAVAG